MKGGYVGAVAFAALVAMAFAEDHPIEPIPTDCPEEDSPNYTVLLRHESDCTKYYSCFRQKKTEMLCPFMNKNGKRLHFNALLQVCDWPNNAKCQLGTTVTADREPVTDPTPVETKDCKNAPDGTMVPVPTRCNWFYVCKNHKKSAKPESCAVGLFFDHSKQKCVPSGTTTCDITDPCRDYISAQGKYFPDYDSCKHLYYCEGFETFHYVCPINAKWSYDISKCVAQEQAVCARRFLY